jgi:AP2 domain
MPIEIPLAGKHGTGRVAIVDDDFDPVFLSRSWSAVKAGNKLYIRSWDPDAKCDVYLHHCVLPPKAGMKTDHQDGDTFNNRRYNLRHATDSQNTANRRHSPHSSKYHGVYRCHTLGLSWQSQIKVDTKHRVSLGTFATEEEAARAYNIAAIVVFGQFANLNHVPRGTFKRIDRRYGDGWKAAHARAETKKP